MNESYVSIVLINFNGTDDTIECIKSLESQRYKNFEVIVIDNASRTDEFVKLKKQIASSDLKIRLIRMNKNMGFAGGNNEGVKYSNGEYIAFLNNDTVVDENWLSGLISPFLEKNTKIGATTSMIKKYGQNDRVDWGGDSKINMFGQTHARKEIWEDQEDVMLVSGASFMMKKSVIEKVEPLFCPEYFIYYEEVDMSWRLHSLGYKLIYAPSSIVYHKIQSTIKREEYQVKSKLFRLNQRNKYLTFYRNLPIHKFLFTLPFLLSLDLAYILVMVPRKEGEKIKIKVGGFVDFIKIRKKIPHISNGKLSFLDKKIYIG